ncbi:MAG: ABC transporter permease, partial [Psychrosphaera sp.]|nr:ABC transporter permease [Psychrosphaera sp.]
MSVYLDIKYAARILAKKPAFTVLSVLIVAVGLGLSLYTYSLLSSLVFKPLVLNGHGPIISIEAQFDYSNSQRTGIDPVDMLRISNEIDLFDGFGVYLESGTTLISDLGKDAAAQKFNASRTQWNIFEFAGVQAIMGRGLQPQDHFEGAEPVIVLGFDTWHNAFLADKNIVGSMVRVEAVPTRVIGVMPQGFAFPAMAETWLPIAQRRLSPIERQSIYDGNFAYARLKEGVS